MTDNDNQLEPTELFSQQAERMLAFWREATESVNQETIVLLEAERQNLRQAIHVGLLFAQTWQDTADILWQAFPFIEQRGYWQEWTPLLQRCLANSANQTPASRIFLMSRLGQAYRLDRQLASAIAIHLEAEELAKATGQNILLARVHYDLLEDYLHAREYDKAKTTGQSAVQLFKAAGGVGRLLANCYKMLGYVFHETGDAETAESHLATAVSLWRSLDDRLYLARALNDWFRPLLTLKRYAEARDCLLEAASLLAPTIYEMDKCMVQLNLGVVYAAEQNWSMAEATFHQANSPYLRQSVHLPLKARVNNNLGNVLFHQGRYTEAEEYLHQALHLWRLAQDDLEFANTLSTLADCLMSRGQVAAALPLYDQVIAIAGRFPQSAFAQNLLSQYLTIRERL
jgi:tetratricopeptide (TPR) repeat protein